MLPPSQLLPPKKDVLETLLARGTSVYVHLDPRRPGVSAPAWLSTQAELVLRLGEHLVPAIPDLEVGEESVRCTLRFRGAPHLCVLPWAAIYALVGDDGRGVVWPEDVPAESPLQTSLRPGGSAKPADPSPDEVAQSAPSASTTPRKPRKARSKASSGQAGSGKASTGQASVAEAGRRGGRAEPKPKRELPPYLRVVK